VAKDPQLTVKQSKVLLLLPLALQTPVVPRLLYAMATQEARMGKSSELQRASWTWRYLLRMFCG
jgi:hypothetical protein